MTLETIVQRKEAPRLVHKFSPLPPQNDDKAKEISVSGDQKYKRISSCEQATQLFAATIQDHKVETGSAKQQDHHDDSGTVAIEPNSGTSTPSIGTYSVTNIEYDIFGAPSDRTDQSTLSSPPKVNEREIDKLVASPIYHQRFLIEREAYAVTSTSPPDISDLWSPYWRRGYVHGEARSTSMIFEYWGILRDGLLNWRVIISRRRRNTQHEVTLKLEL